MALDLSAFDRAVTQLQTFCALSVQPQDKPLMAEALRRAVSAGPDIAPEHWRRSGRSSAPTCRLMWRCWSSARGHAGAPSGSRTSISP